MSKCSVLLILVCLYGLPANSDTNSISALKRANNDGMLVELNASYSPQGRNGNAIDVSGSFYSYTALIEETSLGVAAIAGFGMSSRVGLSLTASSWRMSEERSYATGLQAASSSGSHLISCVFIEQRLLPSSLCE